MSVRLDHNRLATRQFGVGQPVPRSEDPRLVRGQGQYTDDMVLPNQAYAVMVRSAHAHGVIRAIDTAAARAMPGVLGVYTARDLAAYKPIVCALPFTSRDGSKIKHAARPALPSDRVRHVGEAVAFVVAETQAAALAAAEAVEMDIDPLPAVTDAHAALAPGAPLLFDDAPGNLALDWTYGDADKVAQGFARAAHVTRLRLVNNRLVVNAMEPRSANIDFDAATGVFTMRVVSQGVMHMRGMAAEILGVAPEKVRVITGNVGGSFGMKIGVFPEYVCLFHAARELGRPVKWTDRRSESFVSDTHGRDGEIDAELALDAQGHFLAMRLTGHMNWGAFVAPFAPMPTAVNIAKNTPSVYRTPAIEVNIKTAFTNTTPVSAYRGAGRPEANYSMERLVEAAAREMGIDALDLRRSNHIQPGDFPYQTPVETTYDSGEFTALLDQALVAADCAGFAARKKESAARGKLRGLGIGQYLEMTTAPLNEQAELRFEADGTVTIVTGTFDFGQGHLTPFSQVLNEKLGIPLDHIRLVQGDSDQIRVGSISGGSKSMASSGVAIVEASDKVIEKAKIAASHFLEAGAGDIVFDQGRFTIVGTDRGISLLEIAARLRGGSLPPNCPTTLDTHHVHGGVAATFPNGCHIAEVEIDPETGVVDVVRFTITSDVGVSVNPMLVEGQLQGGVVQGLGQALLENVSYDEGGQLLTGSFMDYAMPRADDAPALDYVDRPVPTPTNVLGVKGCGEAGCAGSLPAIMNAVVDALSVYGIRHLDMPATPMRVWQAIRDAQAGNGAPR